MELLFRGRQRRRVGRVGKCYSSVHVSDSCGPQLDLKLSTFHMRIHTCRALLKVSAKDERWRPSRFFRTARFAAPSLGYLLPPRVLLHPGIFVWRVGAESSVIRCIGWLKPGQTQELKY
jgi:hypothetical protein